MRLPSIYILLFVPQVWFVKIGYTSVSTKKRARSVSRLVWGKAIPIMWLPLPFAYRIEQRLHKTLPMRARFYKGDGHSECYWLPTGIVVLIGAIGVWAIYIILAINIAQKLMQ